MSPYATELARARLDALRTLVDALNEAETPDEKRRCAVAIFNAPDPCGLDDEIELVVEEEATPNTPKASKPQGHTPGMSESSNESRGYEGTLAPKPLSPASSAESVPSTPPHHAITQPRHATSSPAPSLAPALHPEGMSEGCQGWLCTPGS